MPYYWIIDPEDRVLIAYALDEGRYRNVFAALGREETAAGARVPPLEEIEIDLGVQFGHVG